MSSNAQNGVERVFATILNSLSKILIKNNVSLPAAVEILKRSLVAAALEDDTSSDSSISLKTGVHRKDVKRLRAALRDGPLENFPIRGLAVVLATWTNTPAFRDENGAARVLPRKGSPESPGFDDLIRVSKIDLAPATVLQELRAQSLVRLNKEGAVELLSPTFVAQSGEAALKAFEATITDHVRIAANNVLSPPGAPRHFDQVLRYSHLSSASVETLEAEARKLARSYLERLNALAHQLQSEDDASGRLANGRFVTGAYVAPVLPTEDDGPEAPAIPPTKDGAE